MRNLKESLLDDIDKTMADKNVLSAEFPVPKIRDFRKAAFSGNYVDWDCRAIIQNAIDTLDSNLFPLLAKMRIKKDDLAAIRISVPNKYELNFYLIGEDHTYSGAIDLPGFGTGGLSTPEIKKSIIEFFKYIQSNPEKLKDVFEYANKRRYQLTTNGVCDELTFKRILKY
jgi:hypothetical protein